MFKDREKNEKCLNMIKGGDITIYSSEAVVLKIPVKFTLSSETSTGIYSKASSAKGYKTVLILIFWMGCIKTLILLGMKHI